MTSNLASTVSKNLRTQSGIVVRPAKPEDIVHVHRIHTLVNRAYGSVKADRCSIEELKAAILDTENPLIIAFDSQTNQPLGTLQLGTQACFPLSNIYRPNELEYKSANLQDEAIDTSLPEDQLIFASMLSVDPSQQSRGVGRILFDYSLRYAFETMGRQQLVGFAIEQRQELLAWYHKLGFRDCGERMPFPYQERVMQDNIRFVVLRLSLVRFGSNFGLQQNRKHQHKDQSSEISARL
ncbi:hypothetical protein BGZ83_010830 [Gryganskiella cystojenkinii]|nr:hypothetical protein BGZ83_010830 [Gryganskiella cystojenkinii]